MTRAEKFFRERVDVKSHVRRKFFEQFEIKHDVFGTSNLSAADYSKLISQVQGFLNNKKGGGSRLRLFCCFKFRL